MDPAAGTGSGVGAGAGEVPMAAVAAPGAVVVRVAVAAAPPAGAAAAARLALNWKDLRRRWAQALLILGCAAAALAAFSINSSPAVDFRLLLGACAPTDAETAALRASSELLLVFAAAQVLGATTALLVPARGVAIFLSCVGWQTGCRSANVLRMLFECHGRLDAALVVYYCILEAVMLVGYLVGSAVVRHAYCWSGFTFMALA